MNHWIRCTAFLSVLLLFASFGRGIVPGLCANLVWDGKDDVRGKRGAVAGADCCSLKQLPSCCEGRGANKSGAPAPGKAKPCPFCSLVCVPYEPLQIAAFDAGFSVPTDNVANLVTVLRPRAVVTGKSPRAPPAL